MKQENFIYGKVPPQARDLEEAILGVCMLEKEAFSKLLERISPQMFYVDAHQKVCKAMLSLASKSQPIDILTVVEELRFHEELDIIGGPYYITKLTQSVVSSAHIEAHCEIIKRKYNLREAIRIGMQLVSEAYEDYAEGEQVVETAIKDLVALSDNTGSMHLKKIDSVLIAQWREMEALRHRDEFITGVPTGYFELDKLTSGWQNSDLVILAARPSKGKTAFALNVARNAARHVPVGLFSLEMNDRQLVQRMLAREGNVHLSYIRNARMSDEAMANLYHTGVQPLGATSIYIDDRGGLTLWQVKAQAKRMVEKFGCRLIVIDYLQLMSGTDEKNTRNREQEISTISRGLKTMAKELNVPFIALSQLSREIERRTGAHAEPQLSDLRESGAIEQDADMVLFLYGPQVAEIQEDASLADKVLIKVAKNRQGPLETLEYNFDKPHQSFSEVGLYMPMMVTGAAVPQKSKWANFPGAK